MSRQAVMNRKGHTLGYIETDTSGWQKAITRVGQVLAQFDPRTNTTLDAAGQIVAEGNILPGLVREKA